MENSVGQTEPEKPIKQPAAQQQAPTNKSALFPYLRFLKPSFWSIFLQLLFFTILLPLVFLIMRTGNFLYVILSGFGVLLLFLFVSKKSSFWSIFSTVIIFTIFFPLSKLDVETEGFLSILPYCVIPFLILLLFINKIYNIFGLIPTLVVNGIIILGLIILDIIISDPFRIGILFIIIILALYALYLCIKADKNKKTYREKFMIRGITTIIIILLIIISFATWLISGCILTHCFPHP